jgi:hypothetical protein
MSDMNESRVPTSDTWENITGRRETKTSRRSYRIGSHERRECKNFDHAKGVGKFRIGDRVDQRKKGHKRKVNKLEPKKK